MKKPLFVLVAAAVVGLGIAGITFLATASSTNAMVAEQSRTPSLVAGITCLVLATGILVFGVTVLQRRD